MTPEEFKRAEELCEKATPGQWVPHVSGDTIDILAPNAEIAMCLVFKTYLKHSDDAAFVAESRELMPKLLAEVRRIPDIQVEAIDNKMLYEQVVKVLHHYEAALADEQQARMAAEHDCKLMGEYNAELRAQVEELQALVDEKEKCVSKVWHDKALFRAVVAERALSHIDNEIGGSTVEHYKALATKELS